MSKFAVVHTKTSTAHLLGEATLVIPAFTDLHNGEPATSMAKTGHGCGRIYVLVNHGDVAHCWPSQRTHTSVSTARVIVVAQLAGAA